VSLPLSLYGLSPTIDGVIDPGEGWIRVGTSGNPNGGGAGANLNEFYIAYDASNLYLAVNTNNTASWDVAYGFGLDMDFVQNSGYYTGNSDAWGRLMNFANQSPDFYALEYEIYFWWDGASGSITSANLCPWTGSGWNYLGVAEYASTGDATSGLQALEVRIPWTDLAGYDPTIHASAWIVGGGGSSAVDIIPSDPQVADGGGAEWTDSDTISTFASIWWPSNTYFAENFEGSWPPNHWYIVESGDDGWEQGDGTSSGDPSTYEGSYFARFDSYWTYSGVSEDLVTDTIDLTAATAPRLRFYYINTSGSDSVIVSYSTDSGGSWTNLDVLKIVSSWTEQIYSLPTGNVMIKFTGVSDYGYSNPGIDMLIIDEAPANDVAADSIHVVTPPLIEGSTETIRGFISNQTSNSTGNFWVYFLVNGSLEDSSQVSLAGNQIDSVDFSWVPPSAGSFTLDVVTALSGDGDVSNDTATRVVTVYSSNTLFVEEFEACVMPSGWTVIDANGDSVSWLVGTTDDLYIYEPPNYGTCYAYYSDDDAGYGAPAGNDGLLSPAIDVSSATEVRVIYSWGFRSLGDTRGVVAVRTFSGGSWGDFDTLATYSSSGSGVDTFIVTAGDSLQILFEFQDPGSATWGWAYGIDNVIVEEYIPPPPPLAEDFEACVMPSGWTVIDANGDSVSWLVGTTSDLSIYEPPDYGTCYAYYSDDDAGYGAPAGNDGLLSPVIDISSLTVGAVRFSWGFRALGDTRGVFALRTFSGGSWSSFDTLATFTSSGSGVDTFIVVGDSLQLLFEFQDPGSATWGWAFGIDNVYVEEYVYTPSVGDILINEFTPKGTEWVELYNTLPIPVSLSGWMLIDDDGSYDMLSGTIPANGYFVHSNVGLSLSNSGDVFFLVAPTGDTIDQVGYGYSGGAPLMNTPYSVARAPDGVDTDDDARDFTLDPTPTQGAANDAPPAALGTSLVINECDNYPSGPDDMIELYNPTSSPIVLDTSSSATTWYLTDGDAWSAILIDTVIQPGEVLCLYENTNWTGFDVSSYDVVYLFDPGLVRVDQVGFYGEYEDGSFQRYPDGAGPNDGYDYLSSGGGVTWFDRTPTPCALNFAYTTIYETGFEDPATQDTGYIWNGGTGANPHDWVRSAGFVYWGNSSTPIDSLYPASGDTFLVCAEDSVGYDNNEFSWWFNLPTSEMDLSGYSNAKLSFDIW